MLIQSASISSGQQSYWIGGVGQSNAQASRTNADGRGRADNEGAGVRSSSIATEELTSEELQVVRQLEQTDRKVRAHEQAHISAGADLVRGGPSYSYETGPDDKRYAVAGEVSIDASPGKTPEETIPKAQHIRSTALAPADPSAQDYRVAAAATQMEIDARMALAKEQSELIRSGDSGSDRNRPDSSYRDSQMDAYSSNRIGRYLDSFA